jgi:hypothetical protein
VHYGRTLVSPSSWQIKAKLLLFLTPWTTIGRLEPSCRSQPEEDWSRTPETVEHWTALKKLALAEKVSFSLVIIHHSTLHNILKSKNHKMLCYIFLFTMTQWLIYKFLLNPLRCSVPYTSHKHTQTRMITQISGICRTTKMNVLTIYQNTLLTKCLITIIIILIIIIIIISYMHNQHYACIDVLPDDTLAWIPYLTLHT